MLVLSGLVRENDSADAFGTDPQVLADIHALEDLVESQNSLIQVLLARIAVLENLLGVGNPAAGKVDFSKASQSGLVAAIPL